MGQHKRKSKGPKEPKIPREEVGPGHIRFQDTAEGRTNEEFERYYKAMGIADSEEEWDAFLKSIRSPLTTTFRITGTRA